MKFHLKLFLALGITILFLKYEISMGQSKAKAPKMMYADSSRTGKPFSKNPFVIQFKGRYLMYSSVLQGRAVNPGKLKSRKVMI